MDIFKYKLNLWW